MSILSYVYEKVTGQPYLTTVSMAAQYGPPPAVEFAAELAAYTDAELLARGDEIVAALRRAKRRQAARGMSLAA